ncbi:MAG: hypothetical protein H7263_00135 [Candidatus Sericytochromatia bacterium]|nr:hypothetical protein [Candidatus Sericytochromatia bacterium]
MDYLHDLYTSHLERININDESTQTVLATNLCSIGGLKLSHDKKNLVYDVHIGSFIFESDLLSYNISSNSQTNILSNYDQNIQPAYSPDDNKIIYLVISRNRPSTFKISTLSLVYTHLSILDLGTKSINNFTNSPLTTYDS